MPWPLHKPSLQRRLRVIFGPCEKSQIAPKAARGSPSKFRAWALREAFERINREELEDYAREGKLPPWFPRREKRNDEPVQ